MGGWGQRGANKNLKDYSMYCVCAPWLCSLTSTLLSIFNLPPTIDSVTSEVPGSLQYRWAKLFSLRWKGERETWWHDCLLIQLLNTSVCICRCSCPCVSYSIFSLCLSLVSSWSLDSGDEVLKSLELWKLHTFVTSPEVSLSLLQSKWMKQPRADNPPCH